MARLNRATIVTTKTPSIISVHDVMPHTLGHVDALIRDRLAKFPASHIQLLVVPGLEWTDESLAQLRAWSNQGYELAGHGWTHQVREIRGIYHFWHSKLISRTAAEHLSQSREDLIAMLQRNYQWFIEHDLPAPLLYVPPAWALGKLTKADLTSLPFRYYEITGGIYDAETGQWQQLPLSGFEADVAWRAPILAIWNSCNRLLATNRKPIRVSIHPYDDTYNLKQSLRRWLQEKVQAKHYRTLFEPDCGFE